jgi:predicted DNA-binding transcriptional regulator AlpA
MPNEVASGDRLLDEIKTAERLDCSVKGLQAACLKGDLNFPPFTKLGRSVRYRESDVDRCIAERASYRSTSECPKVERRK